MIRIKNSAFAALSLVLTPTLVQAEQISNDDIMECLAESVQAVSTTMPKDSYNTAEYNAGLVAKNWEHGNLFASITAQDITPDGSSYKKIGLSAKFLDESDTSFTEITSNIHFSIDAQGNYIPDDLDTLEGHVWTEAFNKDGEQDFNPAPDLNPDPKQKWTSQATTALAYIFSNCIKMDQTMPLGAENLEIPVPQFPNL